MKIHQTIGLVVLGLLASCSDCLAACTYANGPPANTSPSLISSGAVTYRTGFLVDIDGAPNTYHSSGLVNSDPSVGGLDLICNAGNVSTLKSGHLVNLYPDFSVGGSSQNCLNDYRNLRAAGFPECSEGKKCMDFYAVALEEQRSCHNDNDKSQKKTCGLPVLQVNAIGKPTLFYVSATAWSRHGGKPDNPDTYLDARYIPYIVYDRQQLAQFGIEKGDLAVVAWKGHATFAIYGDAGGHLCEASAGTLDRLKGRDDSDFPKLSSLGIAGGATVIALQGSKAFLDLSFPEYHPEDPGDTAGHQLYIAGKKALEALGAGSEARVLKVLGIANIGQISAK